MTDPSHRGADPAAVSTENAWNEAVPALASTLTPGDARQACAVLHGLADATGGTVAAATTSLPERAEEGRNYDYRYVWIRDQCYVGQAAATCGDRALLDSAVRFMTAGLYEDGSRLAPAYTVTGGPVPDQRTLGLLGCPDGYDRVGNLVSRQCQLDAFGEALLLLSAAGRLDADGRQAACVAADAIARRWHDPDAGIWELESRRWTHSRLICAAGLRSGAGIASAGQAASWATLADRIVATTWSTGLHPSGRWQRFPGDPRFDAALPLPPLRGALSAEDTGDSPGVPAGTDHRSLRLPVPARRTAAGGGGGRLPALRLRHGPCRAPATTCSWRTPPGSRSLRPERFTHPRKVTWRGGSPVRQRSVTRSAANPRMVRLRSYRWRAGVPVCHRSPSLSASPSRPVAHQVTGHFRATGHPRCVVAADQRTGGFRRIG
ncbi:glycoside hydrolase family 15 protein [Streptomyces sp. NBC_00893]|uniref:glycoside hydrolase family 15 protein n=1 Tax=Streptomyces sp. NBC_00893 TaxID=2975862 RepID=UPI002B1D9617|nr:glycoside hydrolase family 15 protein [Streptomyces sp. NBC_00893]